MFFKSDTLVLYFCTAVNTWTVPCGGGGGGGTWGSIAGTLSSQADLWGVLSGKASQTDLSMGLQSKQATILGAPTNWPSFYYQALSSDGTAQTARPTLNLQSGANVTVSCTDNSSAGVTNCSFGATIDAPPGGGNMSMVVVSADPTTEACNPGTDWQINTAASPSAIWRCAATGVWRKGLDTEGSGPYEVVGGTGTAPGTPSSGSVACYFDSTTNTQVCLDASGNAWTMVRKWSGTAAMGTDAIASGDCAADVTVSAPGVTTSDVVTAGFAGKPTAITGYIPSTSGMLTILPWPSADNVNFTVCNNTGGSITPGALTLNWRVSR
jgi:hypothetical protein